MRTRKVNVLSYDNSWQSDFEEIKAEIENVIGDFIIGIEHVFTKVILELRIEKHSNILINHI